MLLNAKSSHHCWVGRKPKKNQQSDLNTIYFVEEVGKLNFQHENLPSKLTKVLTSNVRKRKWDMGPNIHHSFKLRRDDIMSLVQNVLKCILIEICVRQTEQSKFIWNDSIFKLNKDRKMDQQQIEKSVLSTLSRSQGKAIGFHLRGPN